MVPQQAFLKISNEITILASIVHCCFWCCNIHQGLSLYKTNAVGIKHGFSCINIRQVPWEVLKTEAEGRGFHISQGIWRMLMHWKTMFDRYYCIKTENICYISR